MNAHGADIVRADLGSGCGLDLPLHVCHLGGGINGIMVTVICHNLGADVVSFITAFLKMSVH